MASRYYINRSNVTGQIVQSDDRVTAKTWKKPARTHRVTSDDPTCQFNANFGAANREIGFSKLFQRAALPDLRKSALNQI